MNVLGGAASLMRAPAANAHLFRYHHSYYSCVALFRSWGKPDPKRLCPRCGGPLADSVDDRRPVGEARKLSMLYVREEDDLLICRACAHERISRALPLSTDTCCVVCQTKIEAFSFQADGACGQTLTAPTGFPTLQPNAHWQHLFIHDECGVHFRTSDSLRQAVAQRISKQLEVDRAEFTKKTEKHRQLAKPPSEAWKRAQVDALRRVPGEGIARRERWLGHLRGCGSFFVRPPMPVGLCGREGGPTDNCTVWIGAGWDAYELGCSLGVDKQLLTTLCSKCANREVERALESNHGSMKCWVCNRHVDVHFSEVGVASNLYVKGKWEKKEWFVHDGLCRKSAERSAPPVTTQSTANVPQQKAPKKSARKQPSPEPTVATPVLKDVPDIARDNCIKALAEAGVSVNRNRFVEDVNRLLGVEAGYQAMARIAAQNPQMQGLLEEGVVDSLKVLGIIRHHLGPWITAPSSSTTPTSKKAQQAKAPRKRPIDAPNASSKRKAAPSHQQSVEYDNEHLAGQSFAGLDLRNSNFHRCDLSGCNFAGANLEGSRMTQCTLDGAVFRGANLQRVKFFGLWHSLEHGPEIAGSTLRRSDLSGSDLRGAMLAGCDLTGADLARADVRGADFRGTNSNPPLPDGIEPRDAIITTPIDGTTSDSTTIWPSNLRR